MYWVLTDAENSIVVEAHWCMQVFEAYVKESMAKLNSKVADLDDVRAVMMAIKEVRHSHHQLFALLEFTKVLLESVEGKRAHLHLVFLEA